MVFERLLNGAQEWVALGTLGEALTVPAINLLLLGYLPVGGRAGKNRVSLAAACGQMVLCERAAYEAVGGHAWVFRDGRWQSVVR